MLDLLGFFYVPASAPLMVESRERLIATAQPDETSLIYFTVPTCANLEISLFD